MPALTRDPALQALLDALIEGLAARVEPGSAPAAALDRVREAVASVGTMEPVAGLPAPPAMENLAPALANAKASGGHGGAAAAALEALGPQISWYPKKGAEAVEDDFFNRHALATLVGPSDRPGCLETRDDLRVGISLVAPNTPYPDHRHPPEELYLALTEGEWRQELGPWFTPGPSGIVYNEPNILHGMRSLNQPQLALWCLPLP